LYDTRVACWHKLPALRVALRVLDLNLDTTTATGRSLFTMIGAIAAFEREMMLERQREGIAKAKAEGRYAGRKPTIDPAAVTALRAEGLGARKRQPSSNVDRRVNSSATSSALNLAWCENVLSSFSIGGNTMVLADNLPISRCLCCGDLMKLIRTVPGTGGLPGLVVLACLACNEVEVKEEERRAA
jgi:hypothetical protein